MKEVQNKVDEAKKLNDELKKELEGYDSETKEEFQGYEVKEEKPEKKKQKKKKTPKQIVKRIVIVVVFLILLPTAVIIGMWAIGKSSLFGGKVDMSKSVDGVKVQNKGDLVIYKGHKYQYNENITNILFMGVDKENLDSKESKLKMRGAGQADTIFVAAVDTSTGKVTLVNVPRDIMTYVRSYDKNGKYDGKKLRQICLAYAYGDGKKKSCENVAYAVSQVLYGLPIQSYMSIDLSAISVLNDAVGGVNVQVIGDLTSADPALKEGANVTLLGGQAETYVRSREFEPLDANLKRMQRQQQYITSYAQKALQEMKNDLTLPLDLLNLVSDNSVTNLSAPKITYLVTKVSGSSFSADNIQSIECNIKEGETGYAEYYPDETKLFEMILKVFYKQVS